MKCLRSELVWGTSLLFGEGGSGGRHSHPSSLAWTTKGDKFRLNTEGSITPVADLGEEFHWMFIQMGNLPTLKVLGGKPYPSDRAGVTKWKLH